jgi:hypothetical protein
MIDNQEPSAKPPQPAKAAHLKKTYQKPAFRYERVFETLALACGKIASTTSGCQFQQKTS